MKEGASHPPFRKSLSGKFLTAVLLPVILSVVLVMTASGFLVYKDMRSRLVTSIQDLIKIKSYALAVHLWHYDFDGLQQSLESIVLYPGIQRAIVYNDENEIVANVGQPETTGTYIMEFVRPIIFSHAGSEINLGTLSVSFGFHSIHERLIEELIRYALLLAILVGVIVASALFANHRLIGVPLKRLLHALKEAERSRERRPVRWDSDDEVGQVVTAYNELIEKVSRSEEQLRFQAMLMDRIADRIMAVDMDGRVSYANEAALRAFSNLPEDHAPVVSHAGDSKAHGRMNSGDFPGDTSSPGPWREVGESDREDSRAAMIGTHVDLLAQGSKRNISHMEIVRAVMRSGEFRGIIEEEAPEGRRIILESKVWKVHNRRGEPTGMVGLSSDITRRRENEDILRRKQRLLRVVIDAAPLFIACLDTEGRYTIANRKYSETYKRPVSEIEGAHFSEILPPAAAERTAPLLAQALSGDMVEFSHENPPTSGQPEYTHGVYTPFRDFHGTVEGVVVVAMDVSAIRKTEQALMEARDAAEAASRAKSAFLANVSHEIRTPMNAVMGMCRLLMESDLTDEQRSYLETIHQSSRMLLEVLNNILDISKIDAGKLVLEHKDFRPSDVIGSVSEILLPSAREKGVGLDFQMAEKMPETVNGDPLRLSQILINLISNGIKFTEAGNVTVTGRTAEASGDTVKLHFSVADTGIGMDREEVAHLFQPFVQADSSMTRKFGGTGLGLTICKRLIALMNGDIQVKSVPGRGTTVDFTVEMAPASRAKTAPTDLAEPRADPFSFPPPTAPLEADHAAPERPRVLLVEDHPINRKVARKMLENERCEVTIAENGVEAVEAASRNAFDLILMDLQMPEMDGYEATRRIREMEREKKTEEGRRTPIIAVTAHVMTEDRETCLEAGMDDHIGKPVEPEMLHGIIRRWVYNDPTAVPLLSAGGAVAPAMDDIPGLDTVDGLDRMGGDVEFYLSILRDFYEDYHDVAERLRWDMQMGERESARRRVHNVKGLAGNIGAKPLYLASQKVESELKSGDTVGADALESFDVAARQLMDGIGALLADNAPGEIPPAEIPKTSQADGNLPAILAELDAALAEGRIDAANFPPRLRNALPEDSVTGPLTDLTELIEKLDHHIHNYDFEDARDIVAEVANRLGIASDFHGKQEQ